MSAVIYPSTTLADLVTRHPDLASELERRSLDYCCGGQRTLAEACRARDLDADLVARELSAKASPTAPPPAWAKLDAPSLVDHLVDTHHAYLHEELPRIADLVAKVHQVHGAGHPELAAVESTFTSLRDELEPHLVKEERILFPLVRQLAAGAAQASTPATLQGPIAQMLREHDHAGELLEELRELTDAYRLPPDACASYAALYRALEALEADTHLHVHIENNRLFPMVADLESRVAALAAGSHS